MTARRRLWLAVPALVGLAACASLTELGSGIAFLEIAGPTQVNVGGSITLRAVALAANGDTVATTIEWGTPDTAVIRVNRTSGAVTGRAVAGAARVQARVGDIASDFFTLSVVP